MVVRANLVPFGDDGGAVRSIEVEASRFATSLRLSFTLSGDIARVVLPPTANARRADGLWRRTCFEAFLQRTDGEGYYEINLSPSGAWAMYGFGGYRADTQNAEPVADPSITLASTDDALSLVADVTLSGLAGLDSHQDWRLGLSAVIEDADRDLRYWALHHPSPEPDFHHADAFTLILPAPESA